MHPSAPAVLTALILVTGCAAVGAETEHAHAHGADHSHAPAQAQGRPDAARTWLAGDHHIHSEFSADYEPDPENPAALPAPIIGGDSRYSIQKNAEMARQFGLDWMVSTDHGGPNHAKLNHDLAYPSLLKSRAAVPEVLQFFGMELDTPGGEHSSLIIPHTHSERGDLRDFESRFATKDAWPVDPARDTEPKMLEALKAMRAAKSPPVLIANHPSRSATGLGVYGKYTPREFRDWNDAAPNVAVGMEGAPGHQAGALKPDGTLDADGARGGYRRAPTFGGFDQMTARLGGAWDALLGEGRHWWITSTSDSHKHYTEGGNDFWPGEYSKTYVQARRNHGDILSGLRAGRVFVTTGDLVSELDIEIASAGKTAGPGETLALAAGDSFAVTIRVRDPAAANAAGRTPAVARVDLIAGAVTGSLADRNVDTHASTRVVHRFTPTEWTADGEVLTMHWISGPLAADTYFRVRGTNTSEREPSADAPGEDPWNDLWFYSNPVFVDAR
jgi:hypothetical protein